MKKITTVLCLLLFTFFSLQAQNDEEQVKAVVTKAYVNGIHNAGPIDDIRDGFHQGFKMLVMSNDDLREVTRDGWISNIEAGRKKNPNAKRPKSTGEFVRVSVNGTNATVELNLMREGKKIFTDNLALYKFSNGWKIVSKTFYRHTN